MSPPNPKPGLDMVATTRRPDHPISDCFIQRWSPRSFDDSTISLDELQTMLEAARWAPSSFNAQPWRFVYELRGGPIWPDWIACLNDNNKIWAPKAAALILVASFTQRVRPASDVQEHNPHHAFDSGAAWAQLGLQANALGFYAHAMGGFDAQRLSTLLGLPAYHAAHAVVAVGHRALADALPDALRSRETPSGRRSLSEIAWQSQFGGAA